MSAAALLRRLRALQDQRESVAARLASELQSRARAASSRYPSLKAYRQFPEDPDELLEYLDLPDVAAMVHAEPARRLHLAEHFRTANRETIFSRKGGSGLLCLRTKAGLLIETEDGKVQSWSRPRSITGHGKDMLAKHLFGTKSKGASFFDRGTLAVELESRAYTHGVGHLAGPRRLFMYARFEKNVGSVVNPEVGKAGPTDLIKVQFDRVNRPKYKPRGGRPRQQGFYLQAHGYPINREELRRDFPAGAAVVENLSLRL